MAGEQEHAAGTGGQSGCEHLLHCFFTEVQEDSRETRTGHRFTFASSLIFHTISSMQALASSLESCPSTGDTNTGLALTLCCLFSTAQHSEFPRQSQLLPGPCSPSHTWEHPEPRPGI